MAGSAAFAQQVEGVTVVAARTVKEQIGRAPNLAPINAISLSYSVSFADLDLSTSAGAAALDQRVKDAAMAACKEITKLYPQARPDDAACAKAAVGEAAAKVHDAVGAAGKAPGK
jgi:UrcA family protein